MSHVHTIARRRFRRLYYISTTLLVVLTVGSFMIPAYIRIRAELSTKIDQLSSSIIDQKRAFLETVIVEKISDIERIRERLESQSPPLGGEEFDQRFRAEVRELIHGTELPDDGYIWINEIIDYEGGDNYAIRFAHPNLADTEGDFLSTSTTDIAGNFPYLEELEGIRQDGQIYFEYYFQKKGSDVISRKLSFAKLYAPYDWVVATGVYLDDVDTLIEIETARMVASTNSTLRSFLIAVVIGISVLLFMTVVFETRIRLLIDSYVETERSISSQLLDEKSKLEEANRQKDRLFSIIAHDLSNPIASLRILSDHLKSTVDGSHALPDSLRDISSALDTSVDSVRALLDDLFTWAQTQRNAVELTLATIPAADLVDAAVKACTPVAQGKAVSLSTNVSSTPTVTADINMIGVVLRNLIVNAIKFTESGGSVTVEVEEVGELVLFRIRDTGVGMSAEQVSRLFSLEHVRSTRGTNDERGTGLGLILSKEYVDRHGGTIEVASTPGTGTEISVALPAG